MLPAGSFVLLPVTMVTAYTIALFFACSLVSQFSYRMLRDPTDRFWEPKIRNVPAALQDPKLGTHGYFQTKNVKLHYVENGSRDKPLMLLIHGYPEFWYSWRHQLKEFSSDYWVVALDMRGFGDSEKPQGAEHYKADILAADILDLVKGLGKDKVTLVGNDWGGIIGWYFLINNPQFVDCYVFVNSAHPYILGQGLFTNPAQIQRSWYMFFYQIPYIPELRAIADDMAYLNSTIVSSKTPPSITAEDLECYKYNYGKPGAFTSALNIYKANLMFETSDQLIGKGNSPDFPAGLLLFGTGDKVLDLVQEGSAKMAANTKLVYIEKGTHFLQQDDPDAVNKEMRDFFTCLKTKSKKECTSKS